MNPLEVAISPYSTNKTRPLPHDYATKVALFWERFHGWKFDIAKKMLDGWKAEDGKDMPGVPHSGYAAMDVMFSYFEPLAKHRDGYLDPNDIRKSGVYFKKGVKNVFGFGGHAPDVVDKLLGILWTGIRCGLYHSGQTKKGVLISGEPAEAIRFAVDDEIVIVNPHRLADGLIWHVATFRDELLKEGENSVLGKNFIARYNYDNPV
jgi:hypothetical protein